ncbi:MAG TPA: GNAT family N-acetyltransferase [Armatimonadota bacterium]|nr:GNAT family N-acetyltransferase [Armatimonadota bacterium]
MRIINLTAGDTAAVRQAAELLVLGFREHWPDAWPDLEAALAEVHELLSAGAILRAAVDTDGTLLGWIGGSSQYDGNAWELHPLVVHPASQRQGIGSALVADLSARVAERGGHTLWLGSDDVDALTSVSGIDLYPNPLEHLAAIRNLRGHPYEFYQKQGFALVGILPDANGPGKPDILMAKRVSVAPGDRPR